MTRLSPDDRAALNLLAGGCLFRTNDRRLYRRHNAPPVTAARIDSLAGQGLVTIFDIQADGRRFTAASITSTGRKARTSS